VRYLYEKDNIVFVECENCNRILKIKEYQLDEVKTGLECFCGNTSNIIKGLPERKKEEMVSNGKASLSQGSKNNVKETAKPSVRPKEPELKEDFKPRCPTCGSTNIQKISLTSKAIGGYMWGIFSSNVRNTFKCNNCGYKW